MRTAPHHWLDANCRMRPDGIYFDAQGNFYRPATKDEAQHGLNDTWPGDPVPVPCPDCDGSGVEVFAITVYEPGCGYSHDSTDERPCPTCGGRSMVGWIDPGEGIRTEPCPDCTPKPDDEPF